MAETKEFEEKAKKVFSAERKEDIWVLILAAITVILGLTGVITPKTFGSSRIMVQGIGIWSKDTYRRTPLYNL